MSTSVPSLATVLAEIPEYRNAQGKRYSLVTLLVYVCVAMWCGRRSQAAIADWGTDSGPAVRAPVGIAGARGPRQATIHRLCKQVSRDKRAEAFSRWAEAVLQAHAHDASEHLSAPALDGSAIDGKTLRGSKKQGAPEAHLLSALSHRLQVVLGQVAVDDKSNESTAIAKLLTLVGVAGRVTTTDALHTQRPLAQASLDDGGAYVMVVKENQPTLLEDSVLVFEPADVLADTSSETRSSNLHGDRLADRHLWTATA